MRDIIDNINKYQPILILGEAVLDFKKEYEGRINKVSNNEDVRELISYYMNLKNLGRILVIEDISFLNRETSFLLLKLVEESNFNIILLSKFDKVSAIILSRIKSVVKYQGKKVSSEMLEVGEGIEIIKEKERGEDHYYNRLERVARYCPILYYIESNMKYVRNKDKIINILG